MRSFLRVAATGGGKPRPYIRIAAFTCGCALLAVAPIAAATAPAATPHLSAVEQRIVADVRADMPQTLALLERAVNVESATQNHAGVRAVGKLFGDALAPLGFRVSWIDAPPAVQRAGHLLAEREGTKGKRLLLIGHLDTVLQGQRWERHGDTAKGNGGCDMKGGDAIVIAALRALAKEGALKDRRILVVMTGDEEDPGKPLALARQDLVAAARRSDVALAFEASVGDTATVARRGVTDWRLEVGGVTAHSAGIFGKEEGAGAIFEASRILDEMYRRLAGEKYLTFNPAVIVGGTDVEYDGDGKRGTAHGKTNVIPRQVEVEGDLRFVSSEQRDRAEQAMRAIVAAHLPQTTATITFTELYPAMWPTPGNYALLKVLDQASGDLGQGPVPALDPGERGAGDISFVSFIDGLDGLGAKGDGSHTAAETVDLGSLPALVERTAILIYRLTR